MAIPPRTAARELRRVRPKRRTAVRMPRRISSGGGGQPGTATSTGNHVRDARRTSRSSRRRCRRRSRSRRSRRPASAPASPRRCAQRLLHVARHRPGDQQHVGVARARDEADAQALEVVVRIVERVDLELAAVARAGVDLADRQRAAEDGEHLGAGCRSRVDAQRVVGCGRRLGR